MGYKNQRSAAVRRDMLEGEGVRGRGHYRREDINSRGRQRKGC